MRFPGPCVCPWADDAERNYRETGNAWWRVASRPLGTQVEETWSCVRCCGEWTRLVATSEARTAPDYELIEGGCAADQEAA